MQSSRQTASPHYRAHWDSLGVFLSGVCLVHCLLVPVIVGLFPLVGIGFLEHQQFHQLLLFLVVPTSAIGLWLGYRRHHRGYVLYTGVVGVAILIFVALFGDSVGNITAEIVLASIGGIIVAVAHILNMLEARRVDCPSTVTGDAVSPGN